MILFGIFLFYEPMLYDVIDYRQFL